MSLPPFPTAFAYQAIIPFEAGVTRRDPSPVVFAEGRYHVWYSKATVDPSGYHASIWHACSDDGQTWAETGEAVPKGPAGAWDENGVFTPTALIAAEAYWLFYTAVPKPFSNDEGGPRGTPTAIGAARAPSPRGPWTKLPGNPLLTPGGPDDFDGHRLDDACIIRRDGRFWMYYKGRFRGGTPGQTKMGVAFAEQPAGPWRKHEANPVVDGGHEVCVWPHGPGVAALMAPVGPEGASLQYAADGLHFQRLTKLDPPNAPGPYRADAWRDEPGPGVTWGVSHALNAERPYLVRFDCRLTDAADLFP